MSGAGIASGGYSGGRRLDRASSAGRARAFRVGIAVFFAVSGIGGFVALGAAGPPPNAPPLFGIAPPLVHFGLLLAAFLGVAGLLLEITRDSSTRSLEIDRASERALLMEKSERRLRELIDAMTDAVALFDADDRQVFANEAYRGLVPSGEGGSRIGASFEETIRALAGGDFYRLDGEDKDAWVARRLALHRDAPSEYVLTLSSGRALKVREFRTADEGRLIVGTDITRERLLEAQAKNAQEKIKLGLIERERILLESESRLKELVESMTDAVYLFDAEERLVLCNARAAANYKGTPLEPRIGQTYEDMQRGYFEARAYDVPDRNREDFLQTRLAAFRDAPSSHEMEMPNGRRILVRVVPTSEGGRVVVRTEISALRRAEAEATAARDLATKEALRRERLQGEYEARLRDMMDATADSVFLFDADERLFHCNTAGRAAFRHIGFEPRIGTTYESHVRYLLTTGLHVFPSAENEEHVRRRLDAFRNAPSVDEIKSSTGAIYYVRVFPTRDGGRLLVRTDITAIRRAEAEVAAARDRAEEASRAKTNFLANMSHELRTPLNGVIGFAEMVRNEIHGPLGAPEYRDYLDDVLASGRRLLDIVDMLLDMAGLEAGRFGKNDAPIEVERVVRIAAKRAAEAHGRAQDQIRIDRSVAGFVLRADPDALGRIVGEILSNAVKFSAPGMPVDVSVARRSDGASSLRVVDRGIGIDPDRLKAIFEPFEQADATMSRRFGGAGLGLSLAKRLMELHGGGIGIESRPGEGATVTLDFPPERALAA